MLSCFRLPFSFDPQRLKADLARIAPQEWVPHFNTAYYEGLWSGAALRSVGGVSTQLYPDPTAQNRFADTEILARCPNIREALALFECPLESVRLLKLGAGSRIREHRDYNLSYEDGEVRIHVPVLTGPDVGFYLEGQRVPMREGESWYINFNLRHRVENLGAADRIHLVVDCVVNDWLRSFFPKDADDAEISSNFSRTSAE